MIEKSDMATQKIEELLTKFKNDSKVRMAERLERTGMATEWQEQAKADFFPAIDALVVQNSARARRRTTGRRAREIS